MPTGPMLYSLPVAAVAVCRNKKTGVKTPVRITHDFRY